MSAVTKTGTRITALAGKKLVSAAMASACLGLLVPAARAVPITWDVNGVVAGTGGAGSWSGAFWTTDGTTFNNWPGAGNSAVFGGTAGAVTVGTQSANGLTFNVAGYSLASGTLTLASGSVFLTSTGTSTLASTLALAGTTTNALTKTGSGVLAMTTNNTGTLGTAAAPTVWTITGGAFASGTFDSVLQIGAGNNLGAAPTAAATQIILDSGTLRVTGTALAPAIGATRTIQVNAAGGAIVDSTGNPYQSAVINNAASGSSFYLSNTSGATTYSGIISGSGGVTWNGAGTGLFSAANAYAGGTTANLGTLSTGAAGGTFGTGNVAVANVAGAILTLGNNASLGDSAVLTFGALSVVNLNGTGTDTLGSITNSTSGLSLTTAGTYTAAQLNSYFGVSTFTGNETLTLVPEPAALVVIGVAAVGAMARRRRVGR
ncbi:MAG: uncharacterized protein JWM57_471 [Phycisphaerales bacterium]|nr:uncharacterized protein [Phycisphaerales bacterium]